MAKFTLNDKLLVARANRILKAARQRVAEGGKWAREMENAVEFAGKKVAAVEKGKREYLKLSGKTETEKERVLEAARGILESKRLTVKGVQEVNKKSIAAFYGKKYGEVTEDEKRVFYQLRDNGMLDKIKEIAIMHTSAVGATFRMAPKLKPDQVVEALTDYVNNKVVPGVSAETGGELKGVRDTFTGEDNGGYYDYLQKRYFRKTKT